MKRKLALCAFAAATAASGSAAAQPPAASKEPVIVRPDWVRRPTQSEMLRTLPAEAARQGVDGRAVISCEVSPEGTLRGCLVREESPAGMGFGAAALTVSTLFRMRPATVDGRPVSGARVNIPINWILPEGMVGATQSYVANPNWTAAPTTAQVAAAYPKGARERGQPGQVALDCDVDEAGRLGRCRTVTETPKGAGFARAAESLKDLFRLDPPRDAQGRLMRKARVRTPVAFSPSLGTEGSQITRPEWGRLPQPQEVLFPARAKAAGLTSGEAMLTCRVQASGALEACQVARETPAGMGFGAAALKLAPSFVMKPWTSDGRPVDGARVRIPVRFEP
jgi:TonB family protein